MEVWTTVAQLVECSTGEQRVSSLKLTTGLGGITVHTLSASKQNNMALLYPDLCYNEV